MSNPISRLIAVVPISVAALVLHAQAFADTPAPFRDFMIVTGNHVFVMLAPDAPDRWARRDRTIRRSFNQSGLYRNDGSSTPLWTVDWYAFEVFPSSDGEHLAVAWPFAHSTQSLAVSFFASGKTVKEYRIKDLVHDESRLIRSVSFVHWRGELRYNDKDGVLFLRTIDDRAYRFSVRTGAMLR